MHNDEDVVLESATEIVVEVVLEVVAATTEGLEPECRTIVPKEEF